MNRFLLWEKPALPESTAEEPVVVGRWRGLGVCVQWPSAGLGVRRCHLQRNITEVSTLTKNRTLFLLDS